MLVNEVQSKVVFRLANRPMVRWGAKATPAKSYYNGSSFAGFRNGTLGFGYLWSIFKARLGEPKVNYLRGHLRFKTLYPSRAEYLRQRTVPLQELKPYKEDQFTQRTSLPVAAIVSAGLNKVLSARPQTPFGLRVLNGVTVLNGVPIGRKPVRLYSRITGILLDTTKSDANGRYTFYGLRPNEVYVAVAIDDKKVYACVSEEVIADA